MQKLKESIRKSILEAAAAEFNEKGFENASMRQIASRAGITPGNIYRYFANKENLLEGVIQPIMQEVDQALYDSTNGMVRWQMDPQTLIDKNEKISFDMVLFSNRFVEIYKKYTNGLSFIAKDKNMREKIKEWLSQVLYAYYLQRRNNMSLDAIKIKVSVLSVLLIDGVIESLRLKEECDRMKIDNCAVIYRVISTILGEEGSR